MGDYFLAKLLTRLYITSVLPYGDTVRLSEQGPVVTVVGDAASSAYYRLGVGMHNIVRTMPELRTLLAAMALRPASIDRLIAQKVFSSTHRLQALMDFQLATMLHEAYCGTPISYTAWKTESITFYQRDFEPIDWEREGKGIPTDHTVEEATSSAFPAPGEAVARCKELLRSGGLLQAG